MSFPAVVNSKFARPWYGDTAGDTLKNISKRGLGVWAGRGGEEGGGGGEPRRGGGGVQNF